MFCIFISIKNIQVCESSKIKNAKMVWHLNITLHVINIGCGNWCILQQKNSNTNAAVSY